MSKKEVAKVETQLPVMTESELQAVEASSNQEVISSDVRIPKLLLAQGTSASVTSRKAQIGDFVLSTTNEKIGDPEHPVEIVPLLMRNTWTIFETKESAKSQSPVFKGSEERGAHNEHLEAFETFKGPENKDFRRYKTIQLFGLLPGQVTAYNAEIERAVASGEAPDLTKVIMPVMVTFMSTSYTKGGKKCADFFKRVQAARQRVKTVAPFQYLLTLSAVESKGTGTNSWYVFDILKESALKDASVRAEAANWANLLSTKKIRVDDAEEEVETSRPGSTIVESEV